MEPQTLTTLTQAEASSQEPEKVKMSKVVKSGSGKGHVQVKTFTDPFFDTPIVTTEDLLSLQNKQDQHAGSETSLFGRVIGAASSFFTSSPSTSPSHSPTNKMLSDQSEIVPSTETMPSSITFPDDEESSVREHSVSSHIFEGASEVFKEGTDMLKSLLVKDKDGSQASDDSKEGESLVHKVEESQASPETTQSVTSTITRKVSGTDHDIIESELSSSQGQTLASSPSDSFLGSIASNVKQAMKQIKEGATGLNQDLRSASHFILLDPLRSEQAQSVSSTETTKTLQETTKDNLGQTPTSMLSSIDKPSLLSSSPQQQQEQTQLTFPEDLQSETQLRSGEQMSVITTTSTTEQVFDPITMTTNTITTTTTKTTQSSSTEPEFQDKSKSLKPDETNEAGKAI